ncbi:uncharacterized protein I303_100074 [Kwoniella dejecticola CBS 10117]|uniref:Uncharacterized protein n=1 Tax=Kwoniella dejecticola CBS 10117 TaxID=1296121 RepID=A0A1A6ADZ7_9TREE|nr:uncharacterized protein I303_00074 [Kwoniella dejecticola CBS 10117]OBR88263.1 hypothetical protein I303_00074 [Kwoniella dejecticola CBS 10117]
MPSNARTKKAAKTKAKSKSKSKAKKADDFTINFHKLHPVHYQILDILKQEIPTKLMRTCHALYDEIMPTLYERVDIGNREKFDDITQGVDIEDDPDAETEDSGDEDDNGRRHKNRLPIPGLKNKALAQVKLLELSDTEGAFQFIMETLYCEHRSGCGCDDSLIVIAPIFPSVNHISFTSDVVYELLRTNAAEADDPAIWDYLHRINEVFECLAVHTSDPLNTICLHWSESWDHEDWNQWLDEDDSEYDEDWSIKEGTSGCLRKIAALFPDTRVNLHVDISDLVHFEIADSLVTISLNFLLDNEERWNKFRVIKTLWNHFKEVTEGYNLNVMRFTYTLYPSERYQKSMDDLYKKVKTSNKARFESFRTKVVFNNEKCACYAGRDEE